MNPSPPDSPNEPEQVEPPKTANGSDPSADASAEPVRADALSSGEQPIPAAPPDDAPSSAAQPAAATPTRATLEVQDSELKPISSSGIGGAATALVVKEPSPDDPWIGRVLDERYVINERLGEGGMGAVFVAQHVKLHKTVAIKVIREELAGNGEVAARFAREAMASAQFEHPHVASAIDFGTLPEGGAYFVMQLVRGRSLRDLLEQQGKLPWRTACELLAQVADALSAARGAGIVHRDLKPENILVERREDGSELAKILDFGIAHVVPQHKTATPYDQGAGTGMVSRELTRVGTVMGTPGYMSPEQAVGDKVDHRTDLYALGVVLWEAITGRCLWEGQDITTIIARQMRDEVPMLRTVVADSSIPRELDALLQRLCARSADQRPDQAGAVRDELRLLVQRSVAVASLPGTVLDSARLGMLRFAQLPTQTRALLWITLGATVLGVLAFGTGAKPDKLQAEKPAVETPVAVPAESPSLLQRAVNIATGTPAEPPKPKIGIPDELGIHVHMMLEASKAADRRKAALTVLAYKTPEQVYPYVLAVARFEVGRTCKDRKEAIRGIADVGDLRGAETLRRVVSSSKSGCGFLSLGDCYSCIRADAERALGTLESKPATAP